MKPPRLVALAVTLSLPLSYSFAGSQEELTPAQVHIRHVVDAINGTPDRVGLLSILETEAQIAAQHATLAAADTENLESMKLHIRHVRHAVDPSTEPEGPGKGYGVSKAAKGVETHIMLATKSVGSSEGIVLHANHIATSARNVVAWCTTILAESEKVVSAELAKDAADATRKIAELARHVLEGVDANGDGRVSWQLREGGVAQAKQHGGLVKKAAASTSSDP
ncbi:MAG: hypothetical protein E2P02_16855 [Acidobacteria bacterium]|nr:MAG: hypothetical protein E2P02_16855 [Acidobacteriota bacterium]